MVAWGLSGDAVLDSASPALADQAEPSLAPVLGVLSRFGADFAPEMGQNTQNGLEYRL